MKKKIKTILIIVVAAVTAAALFAAGFLSARKIYKVDSVDEQVAKLSASLDEATVKLNDMQSKYDEMIALNETMSAQAELVQLNLTQALQICEKSQATIDEIKSLSDESSSNIADLRTSIQQLIRNNAVIKDKVLVLEFDLEELRSKIIYVPE